MTIAESRAPQERLALGRSSACLWLVLICLLLTLGAAIVLAVAVGAVPVPFQRVVGIIVAQLLPGSVTPNWTPTEEQIVWVFRLPRVLLAAIVGAGLAVSGTVLQAVARNQLADPYIFGVSSGASVAAVAVLTLGSAAVGGLSLSAAAFVGALSAMTMVYLLAQQHGRTSSGRLVLAGVALGYVLSAVTSFLVLRASQPGGAAAAALSWLAGSLGGAKWDSLGLPSLVLVLTLVFLLLQARPLNALLAGEETATSLGVHVQRFRLMLFVVTSLLVGTIVALSGAIGFVGLMIPHLVRLVVGADHRRVLPVAALTGGIYLILVDLVGRTIIAPTELPVGIVTAAIGGPFFLWLLHRGGGNG